MQIKGIYDFFDIFENVSICLDNFIICHKIKLSYNKIYEKFYNSIYLLIKQTF